ncbi:MAG: tRNA dihydrouridine synthase DusB [Clostridia bacterium]|nr:tRNA dihydrouridine synthase DusB [Clostridia bacterium]
MNIGSVAVPAGAGLSPMAGVTDLPFRVLCHRFGSAFAVSEMLSAKGYLYAPKDFRAHHELLAHSGEEGLTALQLFGHDADLMAEAANQLQDAGFAWIDVNMGCPARKIVSNGDGSALMKDPKAAGAILSAMAKRVRVPLTVKFRAGWSEESVNAVEFAKVCADSGVAAVTVHPRTRDQFYSGRADWDVIRQVRRALPPRVKVIGNGDVTDGDSALRMLRETGCDAVAVGRAAQGNPWVFRQILCALSGEAFSRPAAADRMRAAQEHFDREIALRGEKGAVLEMRKHIAWYMSGLRNSARLRARVNTLSSAEEVKAVLDEAARTLSDAQERGLNE